MNVWGSLQINNEKDYHRQIGPLGLWVAHRGDEWLLAATTTEDSGETDLPEKPAIAPDGEAWNRYVLTGNSKTVEFSPITPDRPVVVRPESILKIESGARALFYVLVPVWVRIAVGTQKKHHLTDLPTIILSNTWFGEPHDGELCYFLKTWAKRSLKGVTPRSHLAVCPVSIKNGSSDSLFFNRLCIRTGYLSMYQGDSRLWTSGVNVQFRGANQTSKIRYNQEPPDFEAGCRLIGVPRQKAAKEFSIKSFDYFKTSLLG